MCQPLILVVKIANSLISPHLCVTLLVLMNQSFDVKRRVIVMDISTINPALGSVEAYSPTTAMGQVGMAMLDKSLEQNDAMGKAMVQMMERSVNPAVGGNFDMSI